MTEGRNSKSQRSHIESKQEFHRVRKFEDLKANLDLEMTEEQGEDNFYGKITSNRDTDHNQEGSDKLAASTQRKDISQDMALMSNHSKHQSNSS